MSNLLFADSHFDDNKSKLNSCCCKIFCNGCNYANKKREWEQGLEYKCPYCREPVPDTEEEIDENLMRRIKANDPIALNEMGVKRHNEGDYEKAFEYYTTAAGLGDADANYNLSIMYSEGQGVERDLKKKIYHLEEAAIGGHPDARFNIGNHEFRNGRKNRAVKHWIIAAKLGEDDALHNVKLGFTCGFVSKEDYDAALRGHQAAVDATKSEQRDAAEEFFKDRN